MAHINLAMLVPVRRHIVLEDHVTWGKNKYAGDQANTFCPVRRHSAKSGGCCSLPARMYINGNAYSSLARVHRSPGDGQAVLRGMSRIFNVIGTDSRKDEITHWENGEVTQEMNNPPLRLHVHRNLENHFKIMGE
jgi:hypothetical protein